MDDSGLTTRNRRIAVAVDAYNAVRPNLLKQRRREKAGTTVVLVGTVVKVLLAALALWRSYKGLETIAVLVIGGSATDSGYWWLKKWLKRPGADAQGKLREKVLAELFANIDDFQYSGVGNKFLGSIPRTIRRSYNEEVCNHQISGTYRNRRFSILEAKLVATGDGREVVFEGLCVQFTLPDVTMADIVVSQAQHQVARSVGALFGASSNWAPLSTLAIEGFPD